MDITTLAAWGEFIGGIAVVVSLVYLAGQVRQNSKLLRASTAATSAQLDFGSSAILVEDPEVARIHWEGLADRDSLSEADRRRFDPYVGIAMRGTEQHYRFHRDGLTGSEEWQSRKRQAGWWVQQPGIQQWWREWGGQYSDDFIDYVDGLIREGEAAG
jgi:hypothetical protein